MNILVTGGSGFLGINIIRRLYNKGYKELVSLDIVPFDYPDKSKIKHILGDIRNKATVESVMKDIDVVIHCAAALPHYSKNDIFTTNVDGTRIILVSALNNNIKRFIHMSSTAVYGIPDRQPLYESDKKKGVGPYGKTKVLSEQIAEEFRKKGICISILRPKTFVGPERLGIFSLLYEWADTGHHFPILGNGKNLYQLLDVADLCDAIYICIVKN